MKPVFLDRIVLETERLKSVNCENECDFSIVRCFGKRLSDKPSAGAHLRYFGSNQPVLPFTVAKLMILFFTSKFSDEFLRIYIRESPF